MPSDRRLTKAEIAALQGDPTKPLPTSSPPNRSAAEQIDALLTVTNYQVYRLEGGANGALDKDQARSLRFLSDVLATLVRAQRDASRLDGETFDATAEARKRLDESP